MPRGNSPVAKRQRKTEGVNDEWVTVSWTETIDGKEEQMSRTVRSSELEQPRPNRTQRAKEFRRCIMNRKK